MSDNQSDNAEAWGPIPEVFRVVEARAAIAQQPAKLKDDEPTMADVLDALNVFNEAEDREAWNDQDFIAVTALPTFIHNVGRAWYSKGAAIAQPAEPKPWPFVESPGEFTSRLHKAWAEFGSLLPAVRHVLIEDPPTLAAQADAQPVAPVVWVNRATLVSAKVAQDRGGPFDQHTWSECRTDFHDTPISAAPTARQPLTSEQIKTACEGIYLSEHVWPGMLGYDEAVCRAIERAHGITQEGE